MADHPLPMPVRLEPKQTARSLAMQVRYYFYSLYNGTKAFRDHLASVGNADAITGKREFDRFVAVEMVRKAADAAHDTVVTDAKAGHIYKYVSRELRKQGQGLRIRRAQYKRLTTQPAE